MGKSDASRAAKYQARANQKAIEEQRRQFDQTRADLMPFIDAGTQFIPEVTGSATLGGFASSLNEIMGSGALDPLRDARREAIGAQFGQAGLLNSGARATAIADDLTDFTLGIEQLLQGRQAGLVGNAQNAATGLGAFGQQTAGNIGQLHQSTGQAYASGILADAQARSALTGQLLGLGLSAGAGALAGGLGALGPSVGAGGGAALGLMFSDSKLKTNIREAGTVGPLTVYEWDWIPELKALGIEPEMTRGFLAEEVEEVFPRHVHQVGPFKAVDYHAVLDKLDEVMH